MFRRESLIENGFYNESEDIWEDVNFLKKLKNIYNIPLPLYRYVQHGRSLTQ
jgi:hypothetical protein